MKRTPIPLLSLVLSTILLPSASPAAEEEAAEERRISNETELSLVVNDGNSNTETLGFRNTFERRFERSRFQLRLNATRSNTSESRFRLVDPGFTWTPGEDPPPVTSTLIEPGSEPDVEKYFIEGRYDAQITERFTWNAGASWDRNRDAGILSRTIVFGGLGNIWWDRDDLQFNTSYGLSYTDRQDETPDPSRDESFAGFRFNWQYLNQWGKSTTYRNDWTVNVNLSDAEDLSLDMVNSVAVAINRYLSLQVSLQWLYNNLPALEDVDVVAQVELVDPDGIPGSGDEFYRTVAGGGLNIDVGSVEERKKKLDTVFNTSLVIGF